MRVLVTGATGFTGRYVAELCSEQGAEVVALGRRPAAATAGYVQADLTDPARTAAAVREAAPERVFHLAAEVSVPRSWAEPDAVLRNNYLATLHLLEAVRVAAPEARVVVACSSEEYGPPERLPVTEAAPLRPRNPYAASKAVTDLLAGFYADGHGLWVARTRAFSHAGPGQREEYVISALARQIAAAERAGEQEVTVVSGSIDVRRDFVDVRDVARALLAAAGADADVYNVCSGESVSIADILAGLAEHTPLKVHQRTDPGLLRQNEVMEIVGSHEKLSSATGWAPEVPLARTLADMLAWWRRELA